MKKVETKEIVQKRLNELCVEKEISLYKLSYRSAVPMSTLTNIMRGVSKNPGIVTINMLCHGLDITMREFFDSELFDHVEEGDC